MAAKESSSGPGLQASACMKKNQHDHICCEIIFERMTRAAAFFLLDGEQPDKRVFLMLLAISRYGEMCFTHVLHHDISYDRPQGRKGWHSTVQLH